MTANLILHFISALLFVVPFNAFSQESRDPSIYLEDRIGRSDKRHASFKLILQLLDERKAKTLVETGTARFGDKEFGGDGGSTIIFGDWTTDHKAILHSVDRSDDAIAKAKSVTQPYAKHIQFVESESVPFLEKFEHPIDFIYLDSAGFDFHDPLPCQEHFLREIVSAYPFLHKKSIVMFDDCDLPHGGQGKLAIEFLTDNEWKIIHQGYQVILIQD